MSTVTYSALVAALAATVAAHGRVEYLGYQGVITQNYDPVFQYQNPSPESPGWVAPASQSNGFIAVSDPTSISCFTNATAAQKYLTVAAGEPVDFLWTVWPVSHHGPVITYLAACPGNDCTTATANELQWVKIAESGLIDNSNPGTGGWASDAMITNNNTASATIPASGVPAGKYVARHEIIALHSAGQSDGAQVYPQCVNLDITGGAGTFPSGTLGADLYKLTDPGLLINIYTAIPTYTIPGPALMAGAATGAATAPASSAPAATSVAAAASTTAAASSAAYSVTSTTVMSTATTSITVPTTIKTSVRSSSAAASAVPSAAATAVAKVALPAGLTVSSVSSWLTSVLEAYYGSD